MSAMPISACFLVTTFCYLAGGNSVNFQPSGASGSWSE